MNWLQSGIAAILLIGVIAAGVLLAGAVGPVTSSDGVLSVKVPQGWARGQAPAQGDGKPVLVLARVEKMNGVQPHFIVLATGHFIPLSDLGADLVQLVESGNFPVAGTIGVATRTTVAGATGGGSRIPGV
ncbi:MAG: hypothetical protein M3Z28_11985 [Candidatus Dormibacteraeota bacterium]|nr:hypothetical protein [Candidatus Dormibacteraeota bacterium]